VALRPTRAGKSGDQPGAFRSLTILPRPINSWTARTAASQFNGIEPAWATSVGAART
jgi:hypothetical protein